MKKTTKKILAFMLTFVMAFSAIFTVTAEEATTEKLKVMPLGDSITDGYWLTGGYRQFLCEKLTDGGYMDGIDFVGPNWGGNIDPNHAGYSGYSIDNIDQADSISGQRTGISSFIDWLMENHPADVVMLQIGTNDILSYYDLENIGTRLEKLVDTILTYLPEDGALFLATIPCMDATNTLYINEYYFTVESMDACVDAYNASIRQIAAKKQAEGKNVILSDINGALTKADLYEGVHPNAEGYEKMAAHWYNMLTAYIDGGEIEQPTTEPTEPTTEPTTTEPVTTTVVTTTTQQTTTTETVTTTVITTTTEPATTTDAATTTVSETTTQQTTTSTETTTVPVTTETVTTTIIGSVLAGDVTYDGVVNVADLVFLNRCMLGQEELVFVKFYNADINKNDKLDIFDVMLLRRMLLI